MTYDKRARLLRELTEASEVDAASSQDLEAIADLIWLSAHRAPELEDDPVALMLGLVPAPEVALDKRAMSRLRRNAGITLDQLAGRLTSMGWDVNAAQIFKWELQGSTTLAPALLAAIASALGVERPQLLATAGVDSRPSWLVEVVSTPSFQGLVQRWAAVKDVPAQLASTALESRLLATVHRGGRPEEEYLLASLDALVSAVEKGAGRPR